VSGSLNAVIDFADILLLADSEPEPHPELVAIQRPTRAQMAEAVMTVGLFPSERLLRPVVPAEGGMR
jgi:hypothetical protein